MPEIRMMAKAMYCNVSMPKPSNVNNRLISMAGEAACNFEFSLMALGSVSLANGLRTFTSKAVISWSGSLVAPTSWSEFFAGSSGATIIGIRTREEAASLSSSS